ncbi:MAG: S41 family peptidase [Polyangiaceae bacterium]
MEHKHGRWALIAALGTLAACGGSETSSSAGGGTATGGTGGSTATCDSGGAAPVSTDWCDHVASGPKGAASPALDWSAAHAWVRFFGHVQAYSEADQALSAALASNAALSGDDLSSYAKALSTTVCARKADDATLGPAKVASLGDVALVTPGTGTLELPAGTKAVLVDLRDLPWTEGLRDTIAAAVAPALAAKVHGLLASVKRHTGMVDEVFSGQNVYKNTVTKPIALPDLPATGTLDLPLAMLTDADMPAEAVEIAATLRLAGRAWLIGEDLRMEVAESRWHGIGSSGVAVRIRDLYVSADTRAPDVIPADTRTTTPECFASDIVSKGAVPAATPGDAARSTLVKASPFGESQDPADPRGDARAALIIAHGAARTFYPYFPIVGDDIDPRLEETLSALPAAPTREDERQALRRFGNALVDGHNFVMNYKPGSVAGIIPIFVEDIDGEAVIRRSGDPALAPGDTIVSINGVPADTWYATQLARSGGATPGYRFEIATREMMRADGPQSFGVRDAAGIEKTVTVDPHPLSDYTAIAVATSRPAGALADMGAPDLYYINLDGSVLGDITLFRTALQEAATLGSKGLVIDMRGYPGVDHYEVVQRLILEKASSPIFRTPELTGPEPPVFKEESFPLQPLSTPSFAGPIALLVGHSTVSAAENFSIMLVDAKRVHVVGRNSAGTNGNITGVELPGSFGFSFTGMDVRHADAEHSVFHGIGIVPDIEVALTAQDFAAGTDPELEAAITWLAMQ